MPAKSKSYSPEFGRYTWWSSVTVRESKNMVGRVRHVRSQSVFRVDESQRNEVWLLYSKILISQPMFASEWEMRPSIFHGICGAYLDE